MTAIDRLKKECPDYIFAPKYRGDGILILEIKKGEKSVTRAMTAEEMDTFLKLLKISDDSANDYLYVTMKRMVKYFEDKEN